MLARLSEENVWVREKRSDIPEVIEVDAPEEKLVGRETEVPVCARY